MANALVRLPEFTTPNTRVDFGPIDNALDTRIRSQELATQRNLEERRFQQQHGLAQQQLALQQKADTRQETAFQDERQEKGIMQLAKIGSMISDEADPTAQRGMLERAMKIPQLAKAWQNSGIPKELADDPVVFSRYVTKLADPYRDKLATRALTAKASEDEASAALKAAQAKAAGQKGTGFDTLKDLLGYEQDLRKEFGGHKTVQEYQVVRDAYGKVQSAAQDKSAAGDISMIFAYMKMLDPASTVREGEFATAQNATGVPGQLTNLYNYVLSGNRLNDAQRLDFQGQAKGVFDVHSRQYDALRGQFDALAQRAGIDPKRIVLDFGKVEQGERSPYGTGPQRPKLAPAQGEATPFTAPPPQQQQPQQPTQQPQAIPSGAVEFLRSNPSPEVIQQFEQKYGPGSAARALGQQK